MGANTLDIDNVLQPDDLANVIVDTWNKWNQLRQGKIEQWKEIRDYVYAIDTTTTSNSQLPWKNKTTVPKLTQIHDNLVANYMATLFPRKNWFTWVGDTPEDQQKAPAIIKFMRYAVSQQPFKEEVEKAVTDYVINGNSIVMPEWTDYRQETRDGQKVGYVGPSARRVSCLDIVFNPLADSFKTSPKIIRSLVTMGDLKDIISRQLSGDPNEREEAEKLYNYFTGIRTTIAAHQGDFTSKQRGYQVDGFGSYYEYLASGYVEVLTFYGDIWNKYDGSFRKNHVITVVDAHKIIGDRPNSSWYGYPPIFHAGWRIRQDNLWAMGPLDNLIGMQYRIDHLENLKADCFDLIAFPPLHIDGYVDDFEWKPMARIQTQDGAKVQLLSPDVQALNADTQIQILEQKMEEMAGAPKEAMGFRSPGEKTKYEVQRLENAAARIFQHKITQFEEKILEPLLNSMLEMAKRLLDGATLTNTMNEDFDFVEFQELTVDDITGSGTLHPMAARNFAEKAQLVQDTNAFFGSVIGQNQSVLAHFDTFNIAKMYEDLLDIKDYNLVMENVGITQAADQQALAATAQEQNLNAMQTPSGMTPDDSDPDLGMAGGPTGGVG